MRKQKSKAAFALERCRSSYEEICWTALRQNPAALSRVLPAARTPEMYRHVLGRIGKPLFSPWDLREVPAEYFDLWTMVKAVHFCGLRWIPESLRSADLCKIAVRERPSSLAHVPMALRSRALCRAAVEDDGMALEFVPEPLRTTDLCALAVGQNGLALQFVPKELRSPAICDAALQNDACALHWVPAQLKTYDICLQALERAADLDEEDDGTHGAADLNSVRYLLEAVPEKHRDRVMCETALRIPFCFCSVMLVPEALRTRSYWLMACKADGRALYAVPPELVDAELCRAAVDGAPEALRHVPPEFIDEEMSCKAVSAMPEMLACVPDQLCTAELCLEAVTRGRVYRSNGASLVLRYVPHRLRTKGLCMAAVLNQPESLQFVPESLRDTVMYEQAVSRTGHVLAMVPEEERSEHLCILAILSRTGGVLEHVPDCLKTVELCRLSCQHCGFEISSVPKDMLTPELCELAVHADWQALEALTEILFGRRTEQNACECNDSWRTR